MATRIRTIGLDRLLRRLGDTERRIERPERLLKVFGVAALREIDRNFQRGGRPAWKRLSPNTIAGRRQGRGRGTAKPLQSTGQLRQSWDIGRQTVNSVEILSRSPIAIYHEDGTRGPYPIRPRRAKVLAFPTGPTSFAGLTTTRRPRPGFVQRGTRRRRVPARQVAFARQVTHPGLARRRMTPTEQQLAPVLRREGIAFVRATLGTP